MIKLILKANQWYDNMKEPNRTLLFFGISIPIICSRYISYIIWAFIILIFVLFRMIPIFFKKK